MDNYGDKSKDRHLAALDAFAGRRLNHPRYTQPVNKLRTPKPSSEAYDKAEETIRVWVRDGVDCQAAWWALGQRSVCKGWGRVRAYIARYEGREK